MDKATEEKLDAAIDKFLATGRPAPQVAAAATPPTTYHETSIKLDGERVTVVTDSSGRTMRNESEQQRVEAQRSLAAKRIVEVVRPVLDGIAQKVAARTKDAVRAAATPRGVREGDPPGKVPQGYTLRLTKDPVTVECVFEVGDDAPPRVLAHWPGALQKVDPEQTTEAWVVIQVLAFLEAISGG